MTPTVVEEDKLPRANNPRYSRPSGGKSLLLIRFIRGLKGRGFRELHNK